MNRNVLILIKETATLKNILLLSVLFLLMASFIMPEATKQIKQYAGETSLIDNNFYFSSAQIYQLLSEYGDKGRNLYLIVELTADLFFSIITAALLATLLIWTELRSRTSIVKIRYLLWFPVLLLVVSLLENGSIAWLLYTYPARHPLLALATSFLALSIWIIILVCIMLAFRNLLRILFRKPGNSQPVTVD